MTTETDRLIAKREPQKGLKGSNGSQAGRLALHELPILGAAASLRRALINHSKLLRETETHSGIGGHLEDPGLHF